MAVAGGIGASVGNTGSINFDRARDAQWWIEQNVPRWFHRFTLDVLFEASVRSCLYHTQPGTLQ